jgi:undecaprenyl-diphosphatase
MTAPSEAVERRGYVPQLLTLVSQSAAQLVRAPTAPQRAAAARRTGRQVLWLILGGALAIAVLMVGFDAIEIGLVPPRGTPDLWPVRILTDFGKDAYVLWALAALVLVIGFVAPLSQRTSHAKLLRLGIHAEYLLLAVLLPVLAGEALKWAVGRGRPFVGGKANAFNFAPFTGTEAYFSLPSAHAITAFALAFAVGAVWPRMRIAMALYALAIGASRLVLLAHHPSDVVAGGLIGVLGALAVRYWFAVRQLGFVIDDAGKIAAR